MRLLLAIDHSASSQAAVEAVLTQFVPAQAEVRVFHAADWQQRLPWAFPFGEGPDTARAVLEWRDKTLDQLRHDLQRAAERLRAAGFGTSVEMSEEGEPAGAILDAAQQWGADLIVVGSHGRSGLDRFLLGSVSDRVVRHARCSVQVVRPATSAAA